MKHIVWLVFAGFIFSLHAAEFKTVHFSAPDSLEITADLYMPHPDSIPFIILFHQAGYSRGEYREIAPKLNDRGFNALAVDLRSGNGINGVKNETAARAKELGLPDSYLDALPDMMAAINKAKKDYSKGPLIIWGSSYSAALVLKIAGDHPGLIDGVLAFSPGEYFTKSGKSEDFIEKSAAGIRVPVFVTSARRERENWISIYNAIDSGYKTYFLPRSDGIHGSRAVWDTTPEHEEYWHEVRDFLKRFKPKK